MKPELHMVRAEASGLSACSDDDLMLLASAGRKNAFAELVRRHGERLARFCAKWVLDGALGEDLAQEVWLQVWRNHGNYRADGRFRVYLYTVALNRCRNTKRNRIRAQRLFQPGDDDGCGAAPEQLERVIAREGARRLLEAVARLSPSLRETVLLRLSEGLGYPEIAAIVGSPEATVRSRVHLAVERLRNSLGGGAP
jgi:RNA polymerase sigma-70 factor (ECF subfamily)